MFIWLLLFPGELGIELKAGTEGDPDFVAINTLSEAKNLFMAILPIASSIIAFWFAGRKDSSGGSSGNTGGTWSLITRARHGLAPTFDRPCSGVWVSVPDLSTQASDPLQFGGNRSKSSRASRISGTGTSSSSFFA